MNRLFLWICTLLIKLRIVKGSVKSALFDQLVVVALLDDISVLEDEDDVGIFDGGQAVGDDEAGAVFHQGVHGLLDLDLGAGVYV